MMNTTLVGAWELGWGMTLVVMALPLMINVLYKFVFLGACIMWLSVWC
jgi:hypothetical protein